MNSEQLKLWCNSYQRTCDFSSKKTLVMGILNLTPDSFSDGGLYNNLDEALKKSRQMIADEVDIIDIGGESSRPNASPVSADEEIKRVVPIIKAIRAESDIAISIDTAKPPVMEAAIHAGASMINDITALTNPASLEMVASLKVPVCLMHMQGTPETMQINPVYKQDIIEELNQFFTKKIEICLSSGIDFANLIIDPGFGFGKKVEQNMRIIREIDQFDCHGLPLMLGVSRKSSLGLILQQPVDKRLLGGLAIAVFTAMKGIAIIRTHDVAETKQTFRMLDAIHGTYET